MKNILFVIVIMPLFFTIGIGQNAGDLDSSFGENGLVINPLIDNSGVAFAIQEDGKIVAVGHNFNSSWDNNLLDDEVYVVRYNIDGSLDATFGNGGELILDIDNGSVDYPRKLLIQEDGKILIGGYLIQDDNYSLFLVRLNENGTLDNTLSFDGSAVIDLNDDDNSEIFYEMVLQEDQKVILAGRARFDDDRYMVLVRLNQDGSSDTSFGNSGVVKALINNASAVVEAIQVGTDGKILLGAYSINLNSSLDNKRDFALVRFNPDGSLDENFGGDGIRLINVDNYDYLRDLIILPDGKMIAVGNTKVDLAGQRDAFIVKLRSSGNFDNTFGNFGIAIIDNGGQLNNFAESVAVQEDGKLVIGGYTDKESDYDFTIIRLNENGSIDESFGFIGKVNTDFEGGSSDFLNQLLIQEDGKILAMGRSESADDFYSRLVVVRYSNNITTSLQSTGNQIEHPKCAIFPNPVNSKANVNIAIKTEKPFNGQLIILNASGKKIFQKDYKASANSNEEILLTLPEALAPGQYYVQLKTPEVVVHKKIIVVN